MFAGLNVLPKTTFATDYSYKTGRAMTERLVAAVIGKTPLGDPPLSFNLDFHAIPFRGAEPDLENHWVAMRNRALPAVMAFVAQADGRRVICYATANLLRDEADAMVPRFADYWKEQTGTLPGPIALRLARDHLCRPQRVEPAQGRLHHHPPPRVGHVGTRADACPRRVGGTARSLKPRGSVARSGTSMSGSGSTATTATCGN